MEMVDKDKIIALRKQGKTYQSIADELCCSRQYVGQICGKYKPEVAVPMETESCMIDANLLLWYLKTKILIIESSKHFYEVFDRRGDRYPIENLYKEIYELVEEMVKVAK